MCLFYRRIKRKPFFLNGKEQINFFFWHFVKENQQSTLLLSSTYVLLKIKKARYNFNSSLRHFPTVMGFTYLLKAALQKILGCGHPPVFSNHKIFKLNKLEKDFDLFSFGNFFRILGNSLEFFWGYMVGGYWFEKFFWEFFGNFKLHTDTKLWLWHELVQFLT